MGRLKEKREKRRQRKKGDYEECGSTIIGGRKKKNKGK
jgi:hypothetical protein